ncbi:hypothetical protein [Hydrocarboniphaga effusa]|uniref:hypothetical protein n=1 Tax=Hydrocarboniphaga effusa TaxID=243629 RepID=UPI0035AD8870
MIIALSRFRITLGRLGGRGARFERVLGHRDAPGARRSSRRPWVGRSLLCPGLLLWSACCSAQSLPPAQPAQPAASRLARYAFVAQSDTVKVLDGPAIPFTAESGPVFDITNLHIVATKQANGVFVETRFTGSPYKRHSAESGTPLVVTLKSGERTLAALSAIDWTVTCFRTDIFGAKTLLPGVEFERIEAVEIAPMQALARVCVSPPVHRERKKKGS